MACGGDPSGGEASETGGHSSSGSTSNASTSASDASATTASGTDSSAGTSSATEPSATGTSATVGTTDNTTAVTTSATGSTSEGTTGESGTTTGSTTGSTTDSTTGSTTGALECADLPDATAKPLTDELSESRLKLFARDDGYHLLYSKESATHLVKLDLEGSVEGASTLVSAQLWRSIATNGEHYAAALKTSEQNTWKGSIAVGQIEEDDTVSIVGTSPVPLEGRGHSTLALAWNPVDGEWGVLFTENFDVDPNVPGIVHARLYFGRVSADGEWIEGSKKLLTSTSTKHSASISDWGSPIIWNGSGYAAVWAEFGPSETPVFLAQLETDGTPQRLQIDEGRFSRGVLAQSDGGYGLAWGHYDDDDHFNLRFAYVADGQVSELLHLGDDDVYSNDAAIVFDGERFTVSWHESAQGASRVHYARIDPETLAEDTVQLTEDDYDDHDWSWSLVYNGCRHALAHVRGINPSDGWVVLFE